MYIAASPASFCPVCLTDFFFFTLHRYQSKQADFEAVLGQAVNIEALKPALGKAIAYTPTFRGSCFEFTVRAHSHAV